METNDYKEIGKEGIQDPQNENEDFPRTDNLTTLNPPSSKEFPMEVHHHPDLHHNKKNVREYFIEFVMIFLAVTLGFFAENIRENVSDSKREVEFAKELYAELKDDSIAASERITLRIAKESDMEYLAAYFQDSSLTDLPKKFYPAFTLSLYTQSRYSFEPRDGILNQLHSTGAMRYFKSVTLQKLLGDLGVNLNSIRNRNEHEYEYINSHVRVFMLDHYDFGWLDELRVHDKDPVMFNVIKRYMDGSTWYKAPLLRISSIDRSSARNMILYFKQLIYGTRIVWLSDYLKTNHLILEELRKDYTFE